jgi:hypothetical protein
LYLLWTMMALPYLFLIYRLFIIRIGRFFDDFFNA